MSFDLISKYGGRFWDGTLISLKLVILSSIIGLVLAFALAMARTSKQRRYWIPAYSDIYFFLGTPLLIQLFILYYGLGQF